jgi:hypothetical protein
MVDTSLLDLWSAVTAGLHSLRASFPLTDDGCAQQNLFDEFLAANELGLALETLCQALIDTEGLIVTSEVVAIVSDLHAKMGIDDECVGLLLGKGSASGPSGHVV